MDTNGSEDHHRVQAAAGRAVGSGPPSSATGAASSLPPPPPSATDAAVQTRATDSEDPTPPSASAAAATSFGIENPPSDDEESLTSAQIGAIAAAHEEIEAAMQNSLKQTQSDDAPLPPSQIAALANKERGNDETDGKRKTDSSHSPNDAPRWTAIGRSGERASDDDDEDYSRFLDRLAAPLDRRVDDASGPGSSSSSRSSPNAGAGTDPNDRGAEARGPVAALARRRSVENAPGGECAPPPPPHFFSSPLDEEGMGIEAVEGTPQSTEGDDEASRPSFQSHAAFLENLRSPPADQPAPPAQIAATKESIKSTQRDNGAPVPPAQTSADLEGIEATIKGSLRTLPRAEDAPMPPLQIATGFHEMDRATKVNVEDANDSCSGVDPPLPLSQMAALFDEEIEDDDEGCGTPFCPTRCSLAQRGIAAAADQRRIEERIMEKARREAPPTPPGRRPDRAVAAEPTTDGDTPPLSLSAVPPVAQQEEMLQGAQDPPTPVVTQAPLPPPTDQGRSPSNPGGEQQIPIRPPPPSMMPSPDDDTDPQVSALLHDPSVPRLRATLVEDQQDIPVYDAIQVAEQTRFEKNKKLIIGLGTGLLIGAVAAGVSVSSNNGSSGSNTIEPEGVVLSTARPSESSSPTDIPSLRPTLGPSRSLAPSTSLRPTTSLRPSQTPSIHPSSMPTATPPVYCVEIDILSDKYFDQTKWNLVRFDTIGGTTYTEILLEGSPEEEGLHTYKTCLESGDYEFAIFDSWGDGIFIPGYYSVAFEGVVIVQGGNFESEDKVSFSLPLPSPPPSFRPSTSFSPSTYWSSLNWNRQDLGFNGDASNDWFGHAVAFSADALTMAIGAPGELPFNDGPGYVKVYRREGEGSSWEQRGDTIRGEANGDLFGRSLALSEDGTILSVGAPYHDSFGYNLGQVKVYEWVEAALDYVQIGDSLYGAASGDLFGISLDITNGKILAVGASESDANGLDSGQVTIYAWDDACSNFKQRGGAIDGNRAGDLFGRSVSLAGNGQKLAVGAPWNDSNGSESGQVRVFEWDKATSNYKQLGDSFIGDAAGDRFGRSVSFSCDGITLVIGAPYNDENGQYSGQVKVFAWDEAASNFAQIGQSLYGKAAYDEFGRAVALSSGGKTLAIGANQYWADGPGYAEVYGWDKAASEYKTLRQSLGGEAPDDRFGVALALAGNGRDLVVGASLNDRNGTDSGRVEVFHIEL